MVRPAHRARIPGATYRLQFTREFGFKDASDLVSYLDELGMDTMYASPILAARANSLSGYDIVDPSQLDPKLGTEADLDELARCLRQHDMGMLLDIVPNHMAACAENPFWIDVLMHGKASEHAAIFDIDWDAGSWLPGEAPRIILPVLGAPFAEVLARGELSLVDTESGKALRYYEHTWPLAPGTAQVEHDVHADTAVSDPAIVAAVLDRQHYQLGYWRVAAQRVNYRRFFDISDLVGVCVEDPDVFDLTHCMVLCLVRRGIATGLRIDHIDGLRDPREYLDRLRSVLPYTGKPYGFYVVVEKILSGDETLRKDWPVHGTTGYEFVRALNGVFVDPAGLAQLERIYTRFLGFEQPFQERLYQQKKRVLNDLFPGELERLTRQLCCLAMRDVEARDIFEQDLRQAFIEVMASFPVYRTYIRDLDQIHPDDRGYITRAVAEARRRNMLVAEGAYDFIERLLTLDRPRQISPAHGRAWLDFVLRWQQLTGPVTAKGLEDTALYQDFRLLSLNSVGNEPDCPRELLSLEAFHRHNAMQLESWPHSLLATSTHDSKRSEDVRARLHVLADLPIAWSRALSRWSSQNARHQQAINGSIVPTRNQEVLIYQTLLGAWPLDESEQGEFVERFIAYIIKASREAKLRTSWLSTNEAYEQALVKFMRAILDERENAAFMAHFRAFQRRLAFYGVINGLSQVVLKITSPGVPDFYQGTELWTFTLVDPDNRRPVDFALRRRLLAELGARGPGHRALCQELLDSWQDSRIKLYVTRQALQARRAQRELFAQGAYVPVHATGARADSICAYARYLTSEAGVSPWCLTVVPMRVGKLTTPDAWPRGRRCWKDTALLLPPNAPGRWRDVFTGEVVRADDAGTLRAASVFRTLPVAMLEALG